jgi:hypothetical protein
MIPFTETEFELLPENLPFIEIDDVETEVLVKYVETITDDECYRLKSLLKTQTYALKYLETLRNLPVTSSFYIVLVCENFGESVKLISKCFNFFKWSAEGLHILSRNENGLFQIIFVTGSDCQYSDFYNVVDLSNPESIEKAKMEHEKYGVKNFLNLKGTTSFAPGIPMNTMEDGKNFISFFLKSMGV